MNIEAVRKLIQADPRPHHARSQDVRVVVGRYAQRRREQGATWSQIADEVGVSTTSARTWMRAQESTGFHEVVVVDDPVVEAVPSDELVLTSPLGFTLTGCSLQQAILVFRALA